MDTALVANLEQLVSAPRLQRYRQASTSDFETVTLYCWNVQLAEALMPSLAFFEVSLRNAVHTALTARTGSEFWFKPVLHQKMYENVTHLIDKLTRRHGVPPTAGKVISEITFGFWPLLFAKHYNGLWWQYPNPLLATVIPNYPKMARDTRAKLEERLEYFVNVRNRVMHHEAVFQGVGALNRPVRLLPTLHNQVLETLAWINHDAVALVASLDHFKDTYHYGKARIEADLRLRFGI